MNCSVVHPEGTLTREKVVEPWTARNLMLFPASRLQIPRRFVFAVRWHLFCSSKEVKHLLKERIHMRSSTGIAETARLSKDVGFNDHPEPGAFCCGDHLDKRPCFSSCCSCLKSVHEKCSLEGDVTKLTFLPQGNIKQLVMGRGLISKSSPGNCFSSLLLSTKLCLWSEMDQTMKTFSICVEFGLSPKCYLKTMLFPHLISQLAHSWIVELEAELKRCNHEPPPDQEDEKVSFPKPSGEAGPPARSLLSLPSADCHLLGALPSLYWEALTSFPLVGVGNSQYNNLMLVLPVFRARKSLSCHPPEPFARTDNAIKQLGEIQCSLLIKAEDSNLSGRNSGWRGRANPEDQ
ncbi:hypothetical protein AV530_000621 [Patagioenas fasciata monilis]|uniref:Uncharacterized protein n=1 Tax=Patagioenas fasciata monilis TaxID=372326 RepID=A0A1V4IGB1_PATFA|nr:hypothetical protein AV530_000621 [Patagioenas fasciata monilis]